jgi:malate dehydrogenase (oxaloacetate-decarboxylating)(NADP+)
MVRSAYSTQEIRRLFNKCAGSFELCVTERQQAVSDSTLHGKANLLVCPNATPPTSCLFNVLKTTVSNGVTIAPIAARHRRTARVMTRSATVRRPVDMTALAVAEAQARRKQGTFSV